MRSGKRHKIGAGLLVILLLAVGIVLLQPSWIIRTLANLSPDVLYFVESEEPVVALTIDDGPDPVVTSGILDLLRKHAARATFFLISGRIPGNEELVRRIVDEGHELGNHLTSDEPSILLRSPEFERRLTEAHEVLSPFSEIRWFRPGSGWYSRGMLSAVRRQGYRCALGSVFPFDPQIPSSWFATRHVLQRVRPGSIIVLHDCGARGRRTATTLATILPKLSRRGFRVVGLSELVALNSQTKRRNTL